MRCGGPRRLCVVFLVVVAGARWLRGDTPTLVWVSGAFGAVLAVRGDAPYCKEKSANLAACLLVGGVLFRPESTERHKVH